VFCEEVEKLLDRYVTKRANIGTTEDYMPAFIDSAFLESSIIIGDSIITEKLLKRFIGTELITPGNRFVTCIPRHLGGATVLLDRYDEAREYYKEAIKSYIKNDKQLADNLIAKRKSILDKAERQKNKELLKQIVNNSRNIAKIVLDS